MLGTGGKSVLGDWREGSVGGLKGRWCWELEGCTHFINRE